MSMAGVGLTQLELHVVAGEDEGGSRCSGLRRENLPAPALESVNYRDITLNLEFLYTL